MKRKLQEDLGSFTDSKEATINKRWHKCRIGITGANGNLGKALTKYLRAKGAFIIGLTHGPIPRKQTSSEGPQEWVNWQCGQEESLDQTLSTLDILVLNHGINPKGQQSTNDLNQAIEINALSTWRLIERFETVMPNEQHYSQPREIWVNTSEAEIQPALSPAYEISKRLIGQLVSLKWSNFKKDQHKTLRIRKLVLGPFFSKLNPIGIMSADFVANQVIRQAELGLSLIIVSPNPIIYILIPLNEILRAIYYSLTRIIFKAN